MDKPEKVGHYWYRFKSEPWNIVQVLELGGRLYARADDVYWLDEENGWSERITGWYGPIPPSDAGSASITEKA